ncbi:uncharacterized protein LOC112683429 [Sipha flava]|nr:uncharacterized protein LOC112683429 [Sipha flava]
MASKYYNYLTNQIQLSTFKGTKYFCEVYIKRYMDSSIKDCKESLNKYYIENDETALNNFCVTHQLLLPLKGKKIIEDNIFIKEYHKYHLIMAFWFPLLDPLAWCRYDKNANDLSHSVDFHSTFASLTVPPFHDDS